MNNKKGKGYSDGSENEGRVGADEPPKEPSMLSRVTASASGLARSAFASPSNDELNKSTALALTNSGKGQSSSGSSSTAWVESSKSSQPSNLSQPGASSFRAGHSEEHVKQAEAEFSSFLGGIDAFTPSESVSGYESKEDGFNEAWARSQALQNAFPSQPDTLHRTVTEQESRDGEDVIAILSDPATRNSQFEEPLEELEDYNWGLTTDQLSQLRALTKDILPPPEPHVGVSSDDPLNFTPNLDGQSLESVDHWREQWEGVLTGYTDEVWGGLLPLVREARNEVENISSGGEIAEEPKALRRLRAILGHIQQH